MQSLLQGLPLQTQSYTYSQPSSLSNILAGGGLPEILAAIYRGNQGQNPQEQDQEEDKDEVVETGSIIT